MLLSGTANKNEAINELQGSKQGSITVRSLTIDLTISHSEGVPNILAAGEYITSNRPAGREKNEVGTARGGDGGEEVYFFMSGTYMGPR